MIASSLHTAGIYEKQGNTNLLREHILRDKQAVLKINKKIVKEINLVETWNMIEYSLLKSTYKPTPSIICMEMLIIIHGTVKAEIFTRRKVFCYDIS